MEKKTCPCRSGKPYADCCGPFLTGKMIPGKPRDLMRSRYTAFCVRDSQYLISTLANEKKKGKEDLDKLFRELEQTMVSTRWLGLKILDTDWDGTDKGWVEFIAFFEQDKALGQLHERSRFILEGGRWYYLDGEILPPVSLSRNQPCVCGSGTKFKRCHGKN